MRLKMHDSVAPTLLGKRTDDERDWLDADFPDTRVTVKTREDAKRYSSLVRGSVRVALGRFTTDEELEKRRKRVAVLP